MGREEGLESYSKEPSYIVSRIPYHEDEEEMRGGLSIGESVPMTYLFAPMGWDGMDRLGEPGVVHGDGLPVG